MSSCFDKLSTNGCCWVPSPLVWERARERGRAATTLPNKPSPQPFPVLQEREKSVDIPQAPS